MARAHRCGRVRTGGGGVAGGGGAQVRPARGPQSAMARSGPALLLLLLAAAAGPGGERGRGAEGAVR